MEALRLETPTPEQIAALEGRCAGAKAVLEGFASPWVVEFAGLPRSGKSGCIDSVEHLLRRNRISVLTPFEGAGRAPEHLKDDLVAYNAWTAMYAIQQILEGSARSELQKRREVVLLDRGLFDATAWLHLFKEKGQLEDNDHQKTFTDFLRLKKWLSLVRQVFVFFCDPTVAMERELRGKLSAKPGQVVSKEFLNELQAAYEKACGCYEDDFEIATIDTSKADQQTVAFAVATRIFDMIDRNKTN